MTDLTPGSPEWARRITASKVAAILGVSPYESPRSVWHLMHGDVPSFAGNDTTRRGQYLEAGVLAWWRDKHDVTDPREWMEQPTYTLGDWAAATPDLVTHIAETDHENVLVDAKTTVKDDEWGLPGTDQVPTYYYAQGLWAMHVSGIHELRFAVLHSRLRFEEYRVTYDADMGADLERRMREFYATLAADEPPPLDDTVATYEAVRRVHSPHIDRGESVELTPAEAASLVQWHHDAKEAEKAARLWRSTVIDRMGRAQYATHNGVRIARRQPHGDDVRFVVVAKPSDLNTEGSDAA